MNIDYSLITKKNCCSILEGSRNDAETGIKLMCSSYDEIFKCPAHALGKVNLSQTKFIFTIQTLHKDLLIFLIIKYINL